MIICGFYFEKRRAFATGVAVCGSGIGMFIFAPLCEMLLNVYGWKGATWIIAGIALNGMVAGALFRPLEQPSSKDNNTVSHHSNNKGNKTKDSRVKGNIANKKDAQGNNFLEMEKGQIPGTTEHGISLVSFHSLSPNALSHQNTTPSFLGQAQTGRNLNLDNPTPDKMSEVGDGHSEQDHDLGFVNKAFSSSLQHIDQNGDVKPIWNVHICP